MKLDLYITWFGGHSSSRGPCQLTIGVFAIAIEVVVGALVLRLERVGVFC